MSMIQIPTDPDQSIFPPSAAVGNYSKVQGVFGQTGSTTTYVLNSADAVVLRNAQGDTVTRTAVGSITNTITSAGPVANGRDQAGAFNASSWIYLYYIWNGATLATISSATANPTGPTLPAGYTHWAFATALRLNGSTQFGTTVVTLGNRAYYAAPQLALSAGVATVETAVTITGFVPPNCSCILGQIISSISSTAGGGATNASKLRAFTGTDYLVTTSNIQSVSSGTEDDSWFEMPNVSNNMFYLNTTGQSPNTFSTTINITGYGLFNGG